MILGFIYGFAVAAFLACVITSLYYQPAQPRDAKGRFLPRRRPSSDRMAVN